jgi:hypothetical protein
LDVLVLVDLSLAFDLDLVGGRDSNEEEEKSLVSFSTARIADEIDDDDDDNTPMGIHRRLSPFRCGMGA